jgi:S-adenosylmethionine synthetase
MIRFSEYVSPGHPDKIADGISEYLLDRFIEIDPNTRFAVEVQIKDEFVTLGGEVTSIANITKADIDRYVREAVANIGYTLEYQKIWKKNNTICADDLQITNHIGQQSPDIAQGANRDAWGDQGIFFGYAKKYAKETGLDISTAICCCIGRPEIIVSSHEANNHEDVISEETIVVHPSELTKRFHLNEPIFSSMNYYGLFGEYQEDKAWGIIRRIIIHKEDEGVSKVSFLTHPF